MKCKYCGAEIEDIAIFEFFDASQNVCKVTTHLIFCSHMDNNQLS